MKIFVFILAFLSIKNIYAQTCKCDLDSSLSENISCDTIHFSNNAFLYRSFDCDSSWLTFQSSSGKKVILYTLEGALIHLTERLGYQYATEYKSSFLIQNNVISGCCDPPEFILFNKKTGVEKTNIGRLIFYGEEIRYPIIAYFKNSNYKSFDEKRIDCDWIIVENIENKKVYRIQLPKNRIKIAMTANDELFPEHLIDEAFIDNGLLIIKYRFQTKLKKEWQTSMVKLDLKNIVSDN